MAVRAIPILCACALLIQSACSAVMGDIGPYGFAGTGCGFTGPILGCQGFLTPALGYEGAGFGYDCGVASTGGGLPVTSASPIPPVGVSVLSENAYEGALVAGGNLPFLGTVTLEGVVPTAGMGAVSYGCGDGAVGIGAEEGVIATGIAPHAPAPYAPYGAYGLASPAAFDGFGYGIGAAGFGGCGCGGIY